MQTNTPITEINNVCKNGCDGLCKNNALGNAVVPAKNLFEKLKMKNLWIVKSAIFNGNCPKWLCCNFLQSLGLLFVSMKCLVFNRRRCNRFKIELKFSCKKAIWKGANSSFRTVFPPWAEGRSPLCPYILVWTRIMHENDPQTRERKVRQQAPQMDVTNKSLLKSKSTSQTNSLPNSLSLNQHPRGFDMH